MPIQLWTISKDTPWVSTPIFSLNKVQSQSPQNPLKEGEFVYLDVPNWVNIIALTPENDVVFVRQYRHGTRDVTLEIPGGMCDHGEDFLTAAKRELLEETGYGSSSSQTIGVVAPNPAFQNNRCATVLFHDVLLKGSQSLDPHEEIEIELIPLDKVKSLIQSGAIEHSLVVAAFYHFFMMETE